MPQAKDGGGLELMPTSDTTQPGGVKEGATIGLFFTKHSRRKHFLGYFPNLERLPLQCRQ